MELKRAEFTRTTCQMPEPPPKSVDNPGVAPEEALDAVLPHFTLPGELFPEIRPHPTLDDVRRFVSSRIRILLDRRPELLLSILYRIDVSEPAVKTIFAGAPPAEIPDLLTELVIERELQKIQTRHRHSKRRKTSWD